MRKYILGLAVAIFSLASAIAQTDFFGRSLTGQSPNSANMYVLVGVSNETSLVSDATNLTEFEHATRQINLFNLGIDYATQVLGIDTIDPIDINLDTVVGGSIVKNSFQLQIGLLYEAWDRETMTTGIFGSSRFQQGGFSVAFRHEMSIFPMDRMIQVVPATARDASLFFTVYGGVEAGFDSGFSITLEESGILQITTDHLVRDVAEGNLTFDEYKSIETELHEALRYQAPKNTGGSEWFFLATLKGQLFTKPVASLPLRFALGVDLGLDVARIRKRNQNRMGLFVKVSYLLY